MLSELLTIHVMVCELLRWLQAVNASYATILPIMLSTMALPEMEAEEKALLAQRDASMAAMSDSEQHAALAVS